MAVMSTTAHAGCGIYGTVKLLANDFPATQAMSAAVRKCDGGSADISVNLNKDHKDLIVPAFTANPPEFTVSHVTNSTLVSVMNDGLAMPLDDLVAAHGGSIQDMQSGRLRLHHISTQAGMRRPVPAAHKARFEAL